MLKKYNNKAILVVDDSTFIRSAVVAFFKEYGFSKVDSAINGEEAIIKIRKTKYDLVVSDLNMPKKDGLALLKELRGDPALCNIPVVMLTSESEAAKIKEVIQEKVAGYILKPFTPEYLEKNMNIILSQITNHGATDKPQQQTNNTD